MKEQLLMEQMIPKVIIEPVDLNAGANTGARFDMAKFKRVTFLIVAAAGTAPTNHSVALKQHTVAAAGVPAALSVDNPWFHKVDAATVFTKVVPGAKADTFDIDAIVGDTKFVAAFEVLQEDLTEGYRYVSLDIADVGGAQIGTVIAIGHNGTELPAYAKSV